VEYPSFPPPSNVSYKSNEIIPITIIFFKEKMDIPRLKPCHNTIRVINRGKLTKKAHDAKPGSHRRKYIEELTGTVIFDILDCVDSMEILFIREERETFPKGMDDAIIAIALIKQSL
jgi:hypothetical protein